MKFAAIRTLRRGVLAGPFVVSPFPFMKSPFKCPWLVQKTPTNAAVRLNAVSPIDNCAGDAHLRAHKAKIDCEGSERDVIVEFDLGRFRPWIILVESVAPGAARTESHSSWELHILRSDYVFAYFDGLNRFYIARERADLQQHFAVPPNVFDDFYVDRMMQMGLALEAKREKAEADRAPWWRKRFPARRG